MSYHEQLLLRCQQTIPAIYREFDTPYQKPYIYINNNKPILAVAHLDTVYTHDPSNKYGLPDEYLPDIIDTKKGDTVRSLALDDRLGVFAILDYIPKLLGSSPFDVLLTVDEEIGRSTAEAFIAEKDYRWMVEFDRTGTDVVLYQYHDIDWIKNLYKHFPKIGQGSFSDISYLDQLGVCGVNIGVGYENAHTNHCHALLSDFEDQIDRFIRFYRENFHKTYTFGSKSKIYCRTCRTAKPFNEMKSTGSWSKCKECDEKEKELLTTTYTPGVGTRVVRSGSKSSSTMFESECDYCTEKVSKALHRYYFAANEDNTESMATLMCNICLSTLTINREVGWCRDCKIKSVWHVSNDDNKPICPKCSQPVAIIKWSGKDDN